MSNIAKPICPKKVDFMLGSYMEDLGISSEQFESACDGASSKIKGSQFHQMIFEQVGLRQPLGGSTTWRKIFPSDENTCANFHFESIEVAQLDTHGSEM